MARGVNKVILLGNVGRDPETRVTQSNGTVSTLSLATSERVREQSGYVEKTEWHNLVFFGRTAEVARDYVKNGMQIYVEGTLRTRSWEDKESGEKKYRTEIIANQLHIVGGLQRDEHMCDEDMN